MSFNLIDVGSLDADRKRYLCNICALPRGALTFIKRIFSFSFVTIGFELLAFPAKNRKLLLFYNTLIKS
jgi:hypothetical protein